jgi:DNA polymerase elongation subunit (family B)
VAVGSLQAACKEYKLQSYGLSAVSEKLIGRKKEEACAVSEKLIGRKKEEACAVSEKLIGRKKEEACAS